MDLVKVQVTENKMRNAVKVAAAKAAASGGRLWVVFIGHGAPLVESRGEVHDGLLVDYRALSDDLSGLRHSELQALMQPAAAGGQVPVAILDACYSGKVSDADGITPKSLTGGAMTQFDFDPPVVSDVLVLSAGGSDQIAYPLPGMRERRPAFSYLLLGGMRGWADQQGDRDGEVTVSEAIEFTRTALRELGREQRPQFSGAGATRLSRAGAVPAVDMRRYAWILANGSEPNCGARSEWRDGKCQSMADPECDPGFSFVRGRGCVPRVVRTCGAGYTFVEGQGCLPRVAGGVAAMSASARAIDAEAPAAEEAVPVETSGGEAEPPHLRGDLAFRSWG